MAQILVRKLDVDVKARLQRRARRHGRSMEEEARIILRDAVKDDGRSVPLGQRLRACFDRAHLTEEITELRGYPAKPAKFGR